MLAALSLRKPSQAVRRLLDFLLSSQYWPLERLQDFQFGAMKQLIHHAWSKVPYYRPVLREAGIADGVLQSWDDFRRIPFLTKSLIQSQMDSLREEDGGTAYANSTGGSTGNPIVFYQDQEYLDWAEAGRIRAWKYIPGGDFHTLEGTLWGAERDIGKGLSLKRMLYHVLREGMLPLNTFDMADDIIRTYIRYLRIFRPSLMRGYASSLYYMSEYLEKNAIRLYKPRAVVSSAELLTESMRKKISSVFRSPVFDSYGCREVSQIATECSCHCGLHVVMENNLVELVNGSVVVTNLHNHAMPLIRYKIGDMAGELLSGRCDCGRSSVRLTGLKGRETEMIELPNGKTIHGEYFTHLFYSQSVVTEFQAVYLTKAKKLIIRVVGPADGEMARRLEAQIVSDTQFTDIEIVNVPEINKSATGKYRFVYCLEE